MSKEDLKKLFKNFQSKQVEGKSKDVVIPQGQKYITKMQLTGNEAIDMVQMAIKWHQDHFISLRSISLNPTMYNMFFGYMQREFIKKTKGQAEMDTETELVFYDVTIKRGSFLQKEKMYYERYFEKHGQKSAYFGSTLGKA